MLTYNSPFICSHIIHKGYSDVAEITVENIHIEPLENKVKIEYLEDITHRL